MQFIDTFAEHRANPDKPLEAYLKELRVRLGEELKERKKIYLDTNYWIMLRDCNLGRSKDPTVLSLLDMLQHGVIAGKLLCPIGADIFIEILKQSDSATLGSSVELIDSLSLGVSVLPREERIQMELLYFVRKYVPGGRQCHPPNVFAWTKLAYTLGFNTFHNAAFKRNDELVMQKAFLDQMWCLSLSEIIKIIGIEAISRMPRMQDFSSVLNAGKISHANENRSFEQMFLSEIAGVLDTMLPEFREMFAYLYERSNGVAAPRDETESMQSIKLFANLIYQGFRLNRIKTELPAIRIPATLHACIRWDSRRKYKASDYHDINHAEAALPYFDAFFTERSLRDLVTRSNTRLDVLYNCHVVSDPCEALQVIEKVVN